MDPVAPRYARALAAVAESTHMDVAAAQQQMQDFADTLSGSRELREFLTNPSIPQDQKLKVLDAISGRIGMFPPVRNFIAVIMDHHRLAELGEILSEYGALSDRQAGVTEAEITSARPMDEQDRRELEQRVAVLAGGKVRTTYTEDASLLGGAVVRIGSTVYDGSVRAQLQQLRQRLVNA